MTRLVLAGITAAAALGLATSATAAPVATPSGCRERIAIECVRVAVPVDRAGRDGGTISLYAERLGDDQRRTRALLFLAGGPGQAATPLVTAVAPALASVLGDRDVVILDQRGTGRSGQLRCTARRGASERAQLAACARHLGAARNHYATADSVADIEDVRTALGIDQLTLYGTSYGTKVALEYAVAHPEHVEALVLDSVVPEGPVEVLQRSSWAALPRILHTLCGAGRCRGITADPVGDLAAVERRLATRPRVRRITSRGRVVRDRLGAGFATDLAYEGDFSPELRAALPAVLHAARTGDLAPLTRIAERAYAFQTGSVVDDPLYIATTCADDAFPWPAGASREVRRRAADRSLARFAAGLPFRIPLTTLQLESSFDPCVDWPAAPPAAKTGPLPDVPALIVTGTADLRTPSEDARAVARRLPRSQTLVVRGSGHSVIGATVKDCPGRALLAFLHGGRIRQCAALEVQAPTRLPPLRISAARPWRGLPDLQGRILRAALATVADVRTDAVLSGYGRVGGLRGGWLRVGFGTVVLHATESVGGLRVSGRVAGLHGDARLRVAARAVRGTLRVRGHLVTGRINGRRVRARLGR